MRDQTSVISLICSVIIFVCLAFNAFYIYSENRIKAYKKFLVKKKIMRYDTQQKKYIFIDSKDKMLFESID